MLNDLIFSFNAVMPLFLVIAAGFFLRGRFLGAETCGKLNALVYNVALPLMLFRDIAASDFFEVLDVKLILFAVASTLVVFSAACLIATKAAKPGERGAFIQGAFRGNYAIMGMQVISNILGGAQTGKAALIVTFVIPLYNVLAIFILTIKPGGGQEGGGAMANARRALANIAKNPLIIGILLGMPFSLLKTRLPVFISGAVNSVAGMASPLALLSIGAAIDFRQLRGKLRPAVICAALKLAVTPLIFVPAALAMGFAGEPVAILFVMLSAPTAINSYIMAEMTGNDSALAANIVLLTTMGSMFTFTVGIFCLRTIGAI